MAFAYDCFKKYERKEFLTRSELEYADKAICNDQLVNFFENEEQKTLFVFECLL